MGETEIYSPNFFYISLVLCIVALLTPSHASYGERKVYIVYMGNLDERDQSHSLHHFNMLQEVVDTSFVRQSLVRSYTKSFNGFAANLTVQEKEKLASHEDVVSIFPSTVLQTQTTRSWDFMGFPENVHRNPTIESDTIVGVIDTGIWPESESFNDKGFSPPPKKWKGACNGGTNFTCNNKLIGARYYTSDSSTDASARDTIGHGTHTASTAAGNYVQNASFYGLAQGTARGGVPSARIAAYKVCSPGCSTSDVLAAFDDAIADGVDIITISLGGFVHLELQDDVIAIGSLHASLKGILVVHSAGNYQTRRSVVSTAPWIFTVAASTTDRGIITKVALGNGTVLSGKAVNPINSIRPDFPLVYGKEVTSRCSEVAAQFCSRGCLNNSLVKGKIVLCNTFSGISEAFRSGALGSIAATYDKSDVAFIPPLPALGFNPWDLSIVKSYYNSTKNPKVNIPTGEAVKNLDAPLVASFSSRGPNPIIPDILKPDITAPGVEILAAFSPAASPSQYKEDKRSVNYTILSGTSMACPHVAGAAAYVKSLHPNWSPSAIKSALMTTAWRMNATKDPDAEFSYGSGHIDPEKAADPGLVYQTSPEDYPKMLCSLGYDSIALKKIFGVNNSCSEGVKAPKDVNYPSITYSVNMTTQSSNESIPFSEKFTRTVTNVGNTNSTYKAIISKSSDYNISVSPSILTFAALNEEKSFEVIVSGKMSGKIMSAALEWSDGVHSVRSPIVVYPDNLSSNK